MLFEQSGSEWLWWVCISRLESEWGRGGWAFCKKYSALFARGWLVSACPFPRHCVVWCLQKVMLGRTLTEQRSKEIAKLTHTFLGRVGKTEASSAGTICPSALATSSTRLVLQCQWIPLFIGCLCLWRVWKCLDQPRRSTATLGA